MTGRFVRLTETDRAAVTIELDGESVTALQGDTLLVAMLAKLDHVRLSEFGDGRRAGFCLMGACQDCWVWTSNGERLRACSTQVSSDLKITTREPRTPWSHA